MTSNQIRAALSDLNPDAVFFDNLDDALIGVGRLAHFDPVPVYSKAAIFAKFAKDGFSQEDALEYFSSKCVGIFAGPNTPVIIDDLNDVEEE